jgi:uncharacterized protein (UPF0248 family)
LETISKEFSIRPGGPRSVIPIHSLLARIRWDPDFGRGRWEIAYLDRARMGLVRLPLDEIRTQPGVRFMFDVVDEEGATHSVPYHRVREVRRDGKVIWSRLAPTARKWDEPKVHRSKTQRGLRRRNYRNRCGMASANG